jgi:type IV pilus assembly protein PilO
MSRNYKELFDLATGRTLAGVRLRDPRVFMRVVLGLLVAANLVAAVMVFRPWGGSVEDLDRQLSATRVQLAQRQADVQRLRTMAAKVEKARREGDRFLDQSFVSRAKASSTIVAEVTRAAKQVGLRPREHSFVFEPVEGSDTLSMMTVNGNYEGTYNNLVSFLNLLDRSPRFLIIEYLQASPQQQSAGVLNVSIKLNTFVREGGEAK